MIVLNDMILVVESVVSLHSAKLFSLAATIVMLQGQISTAVVMHYIGFYFPGQPDRSADCLHSASVCECSIGEKSARASVAYPVLSSIALF